MNAKALFTGFFVLGGLSVIAAPAFSQQSPPESEKAKHIVVLVEKAAALIDKQGKEAFPEFRLSGSEWISGDTYIFVSDFNGNVLVNSGVPKVEGTNTARLKDSNGKILHAEFLNMVKSSGSGWVDYMFPKPGQTKSSKKWSYVKAVKVDGAPSYVGAGFFPE